MKRHLIFDLDGTLVDSCAGIVGVINAMLADRRSARRIDPAFARPHMSGGGQYLVTTLLADDATDPAADLADYRRRYQARATSVAELYEGVAEGIAALHAEGYRLAICSNKPQYLCEKVLADTGLSGFFEVIVGGREDLRPKPETDMVEAVLRELGCAADQCLYIGDSDVDHDTARAAGLPFLFVRYGYAADGWVPEQGDSFDTFADVVAAIRARETAHA